MSEIHQAGSVSASVVLSKTDRPNKVLMGKINQTALWDHIGGLDSGRVERHSKEWMLPSSHLILGEDP